MSDFIIKNNIIPAQAIDQSSKASPADIQRARQAAEEFEAIFLSQLMKNMSTGLKADSTFGGGFAEDLYQDVLNEKIGEQIAKTGGIGISDAIFKELIKEQEVE